MSLYIAPENGIPVAPVRAPGASPPTSLNIAFVTQRPQGNWCWAACAVMVANHLQVKDADANGPVTMCHLAGVLQNVPNCCANPDSCDNGAWPEQAYQHLHISYNADVPSPPSSNERVLTPEEIRKEVVDNRRPVEVFYKWSTHGAHVVLITGISDDNQYEVLDPWFGVEFPVTYDYIKTARGLGRWAGTYFELRLAPAA